VPKYVQWILPTGADLIQKGGTDVLAPHNDFMLLPIAAHGLVHYLRRLIAVAHSPDDEDLRQGVGERTSRQSAKFDPSQPVVRLGSSRSRSRMSDR